MQTIARITVAFVMAMTAASAAAQTPAAPADSRRFKPPVSRCGSALGSQEDPTEAAATKSVIDDNEIRFAAARAVPDLLRRVPGLNVIQLSARDFNITSRRATGLLAVGESVLLDGRSVDQSLFGFTLWDLLPIVPEDIRRVEVIQGPGSALCESNAVDGTVNIVTKIPREVPETTIAIGAVGLLDRAKADTALGGGLLWYLSGSRAKVLSDRWALKVSAGVYVQNPFARPASLPGENVSIPAYVNRGTAQPKVNGRADYDFVDGRTLSLSGGFAASEGVMQTPAGPLDLAHTAIGYGQVRYAGSKLRSQFFINHVDGSGSTVRAVDSRVTPESVSVGTTTYSFDVSSDTTVGRTAFTYGAFLRINTGHLESPEFQYGTAAGGGGVGQADIMFTSRVRLVVGARLDRFETLSDLFFAPRATVVWKPEETQSLRLSYNRAYLAPSVLNTFLEATVTYPIDLGRFNPSRAGEIYGLPVRLDGDRELGAQSVDSFEAGYTGELSGAIKVTGAFYRNRLRSLIGMREVTSERYTAQRLPPGWPLPPDVALATDGGLPARYIYSNLGDATQWGAELGLTSTWFNDTADVFANYSWQGTPDPSRLGLTELNTPPKHRINAGIAMDSDRFIGNLTIAYGSDAIWQDVIDPRFRGATDAYTQINANAGVRWRQESVTTSVKVINLMNATIQQHVLGDVLSRQFIFDVRVRF